MQNFLQAPPPVCKSIKFPAGPPPDVVLLLATIKAVVAGLAPVVTSKLVVVLAPLSTAKAPPTVISPVVWVRMESPIALLPVNIGIIVAVPPPVIPEVPPPPPLGLVIHGWVVNDNPPLPLEIMQVLLAPTVAGKVKVKLLPPPLKATQTSPLAAGMTKVLCPPLGAANVRVVVLPPLVEVSLVLVALLPCRVRGNGEGEMVPTVKVPLDGAIVPALIVPIPLLPTVKMPPTVILLVPV